MARRRKIAYKPRDDMVRLNGVVTKAHSAFDFDVQLEGAETTVRAYVAGRMKVNHIRIVVGDRVEVEFSPYDLTKGRIVYRHK